MWPDKRELDIMQIKSLFDILATWHIFCSLSFNEEVFLIGMSTLQQLNTKLRTFMVDRDIKMILCLYVKHQFQNTSISITFL